ncbi:MAG: tetratricopeptide repeat protein [Syntrophaceae bacterium]|nr:tetratricopeptide repeat protein [Syntrophaceae bacterium]
MKLNPKRIAVFSLLLVLSVTIPAFAETRTFIKEYTYQASEDDSRNSSRVIALREVKRLLLEELGTYLESETEVKNVQLTRDQITTLTAGIVQTEVIQEKWDGRVYWLKSKIAADSDKVVQSINDLRKDREKTKELEMMRKKSDALLKEVEKLRKELASAKDGNREAKKTAYDLSIKELSAKEWLEKGFAAKDRRAFKEAVEAYGRAIELDPDNIEAYYARAVISDENHAMQDFYKLLTKDPKDSKAFLYRAWTYKELNKPDLALREFGKAIEAAPSPVEKAEAYFERGKFYYAVMRNHRLAIQDYTRAIELRPKDADYYFYRGTSYSGLQNGDLAYSDFSKAVELAPRDASNYLSRGSVLLNLMNKPESAIADYSKAVELEPIGFNFKQRGIMYEMIGRKNLALSDYSKAAELYGDDASRRGDYEFAIDQYNDAVKLKPERATLFYKRALVYALMGDSKKALTDLKKAMELDSSCKDSARKAPQFNSIRNHPGFIKLVGK